MAIMASSKQYTPRIRSDSGRCYEPTKERYVFNLPQTHPSLTRNVECVGNVKIYYSKHNGILIKWQTFGFDFT
jgi:hypothetical protein